MNWERRIITAEQLAPYLLSTGEPGLRAQTLALIEQQKDSWSLLGGNYDALKRIETKRIRVEQSDIFVQHNPARLRSTSARVDKESVGARPCFLCSENLPAEEKGINYGENLVILCNPFPVLDRHLSIVHREHVPQRIEGNVEVLLDLARDLAPDYFTLYNGPECGASAPDHLHFQAASRALLPIESDLTRTCPESERAQAASDRVEAFTLPDCGRSVIIFKGASREGVAERVYGAIGRLSQLSGKAEPMINLILTHSKGLWTVYMFPRARHRPARFFAEGDERLTVSPGAIDMAGVIVVPDRSDFDRVDSETMKQIFSEVSLTDAEAREAIRRGEI